MLKLSIGTKAQRKRTCDPGKVYMAKGGPRRWQFATKSGCGVLLRTFFLHIFDNRVKCIDIIIKLMIFFLFK